MSGALLLTRPQDAGGRRAKEEQIPGIGAAETGTSGTPMEEPRECNRESGDPARPVSQNEERQVCSAWSADTDEIVDNTH